MPNRAEERAALAYATGLRYRCFRASRLKSTCSGMQLPSAANLCVALATTAQLLGSRLADILVINREEGGSASSAALRRAGVGG